METYKIAEFHLLMAFVLGAILGTFFISHFVGIVKNPEYKRCNKCRHISLLDFPAKDED